MPPKGHAQSTSLLTSATSD